MKMIQGSPGATIADYGSYSHNCTERQLPYKIPVNSLSDVQLFIAFGGQPDTIGYELIHTCGGGTTESITPGSYVVGQDTNDSWYGVFKNFSGASPTCFVIAITVDFGGTERVYFSEEYCVESNCGTPLVLIKGCYGNLDSLISHNCQDIYFGPHAGSGSAMGDVTVTYQHQFFLRGVEVTLSAIKNSFKQGRTRNFRTEKEKIYQFMAELVPEWYIPEVDAVFYRGEVFVGGTKYLVNETAFEKVEECKRQWKPTATFKDSCFQSFSCEEDPCTFVPPDSGEGGESGEESGSGGGGESGETPYSIALVGGCTGINSSYLLSGGTFGDLVTVRATFAGLLQKTSNAFTRADLFISSPNGTSDTDSSACYTDTMGHGFSIFSDTVITMPGANATINLSAVIHNGSSSPVGVSLEIIDVNGEPVSETVGGCAGNDSDMGTC